MLDGGLRASELLELSLTNARLEEGFLKVLGKGNKERLIPVGRRCQEALRVWLERFRPQFDPDGLEARVFLNANGQRMTLRSLEEMLGRSGTRAGISGLRPHRLRHTFATRFLTLELGDTFQLQQLLGPHKSRDGQTICLHSFDSARNCREPSFRHGPSQHYQVTVPIKAGPTCKAPQAEGG